jgi:adenosylmethionine-8-amino-7-oxononanoate aminotransferase
MLSNRHIWYPFSQQKLSNLPIHITYGKGALLFAEDGTSYIDAISSWWTNIHGHAHPALAAAIYEQFQTLEHVIFAGFTHSPAEQLAERLLQYTPWLDKVFFSDNGSTAVEVGIKMALQFWYNQGVVKNRIIAINGAYHGDTFGAMSVSGRDAFTQPFQQQLFDTTFIPFPAEEDKEVVLTAMKTACETGEIAAFIYEPLVQGAAGMRMYTPTLLNELIAIAKEHRVLCIADEVMTGFYRTGTLWASLQCDHKPDIICLSKGITGGSMPLAVTICSRDIYDAFYSDDRMKAFYHGHSYTGNPLACAVANASLTLLELPETKAQIHNIVQKHMAFSDSIKSLEGIHHVRQRGTIWAGDIDVGDSGYFSSIRDLLYQQAIDMGVLLRPLGNTLYIMPPYCIHVDELNTIYSTIIHITERAATKLY